MGRNHLAHADRAIKAVLAAAGCNFRLLIRAHPDWVEIVMRSKFFDFAHVLFGKPVPTFPEHALGG